ncbi:MAG: vWA domain-containing protein [Phycisphaerae bacterium]
MQWLNPWGALLAAAVAVPLLVLLYFLKLKRREEFVSSTLLWQRAVQDLQVNAPFQKLRKNILLLLQLLALIALLVALARPVMSMTAGGGNRYVILIDRSASMNATDADGRSRLEAAQEQAREFVEAMKGGVNLALQDSSDQAMIIAFDANAKVMTNFTSDRAQLLAAIDAIEPTDAPSRLNDAITVARAFVQSAGEEVNNRSAVDRAGIELFSDGKIADLHSIVIEPEEVTYHRIGSKEANTAIVEMRPRRSYEQAEELTVFASLANFGPAAVTTDVELSIDGDIKSVRSVTIPARKVLPDVSTVPGKTSVTFRFTHPGAGVLRLRLLGDDLLQADNTAWAVLQPPRKLDVLLVAEGNLPLQKAFRSLPLAGLEIVTPTEFEQKDPDEMAVRQPYDLIVLDNIQPDNLPKGNYLVFGRPPKQLDIVASLVKKPSLVIDWRTEHPIMHHVNLERTFVAEHYKLDLPRDAVVLGEFAESAAFSLLRRRGSTFLLAGFDIMQTNWPFDGSFLIFCYNVAEYLGSDLMQNNPGSVPVGTALTVQGSRQGGVARVTTPDGRTVKISPDGSGTYRFPGTGRVGVYRIAAPRRAEEFIAVNLLNESESAIEPAGVVEFAGREQGTAAEEDVYRATQEFWPWLALICLVLVCVEWLVYNRKMRF